MHLEIATPDWLTIPSDDFFQLQVLAYCSVSCRFLNSVSVVSLQRTGSRAIMGPDYPQYRRSRGKGFYRRLSVCPFLRTKSQKPT